MFYLVFEFKKKCLKKKMSNSEPNVILNQGIIFCRQNKYRDANKCYEKAIKLNSSDSVAYSCKANALNKLKEYKKAVKYYDKAISLNPNDPIAYNNRGISLARLSKYQEALASYDKAIELNANYAKAYCNKG